MTTFKFKQTRLIAALLTAGVIGGIGAVGIGQLPHAAYAQTPAATATVPVVQPNMMEVPNFAAIVAREGKAVVNISTSGTEPASEASGQIDPGLRDFLRQFGLPPGAFQFNPPSKKGIPIRGEGSGFIISPDGLILTNAHVVKGATKVTVKLTDRREYQAKVLGMDPKTDIAVVKIDAHDLPTVTFGDSTTLRPGDWVLAIGSPFGFENSVTAGIVSAKGRSLPDDSAVPFIQTDVAVNPGNSGGPLFNLQGQVVGINSQIYTRSGGFQGISFAIPIELAQRIEQQIVAHGKVEHAKLGVTIQDVNQTFADSFGLPSPEGALIAKVDKDSAASAAGLKPGDVILKADGKDITSSSDLPSMIALAKPGDELHMEIWRDGKAQQITAKLQAIGSSSSTKPAETTTADSGKLGLALRPLQPDERRQAHVSGGLLVEDASGAAAAAGVQQGDILLAIDGEPATGVDEVRNILKKAGNSVALLIWRDGNQLFVPVPLS
jgi:serine protease Do